MKIYMRLILSYCLNNLAECTKKILSFKELSFICKKKFRGLHNIYSLDSHA